MQMDWSVVRSKYLMQRFQNYEADDEPRIIELHGDREESVRRDTHLSYEEYALQQYLQLNAQKNDWLKVKKTFRQATDHKLFSDVQYRNSVLFYSYMDFSRGLFKPIFYRAKSLKDLNPHVVLDSNEISGSVVEHEYSPNGRYCAFTICNEIGPSFIHVVNVETGENCGQSLKFEELFKKNLWSKDSKGFFVYYDPKGGDKRSIFYHYLDKRKRDVPIVAIRATETESWSLQISADFKYLILCESRMVSIANIESLDVKIEFKLIFLIVPDVTYYEFVGNDGENFMFLTNLGAPVHRVIEISFNAENRDSDSFEVIVAENFDGHGVLQSAYKYGAFLFLIYIENFQNSLYLYSLQTKRIEFQIDLKDEQFLAESIDEFGFYFETMSYASLQKIYRIDFVQLFDRSNCQCAYPYTQLQPTLIEDSNVANLSETEIRIQHDSFYSFDWSNVPLTIIQKKNNDPNKPCLVFSYGGFNVPLLPQFKLIYLLFIQLFNGIVVIIYIRDGGELGDDWLLKSSEAETSFNDLIAGVEYLKSETYKTVIDLSKIAFFGISHGGVAGSVAMNKRQDLFRAVILQYANVDLIHDLPNKGHNWTKQYGDLKKKEDYDHLKRYAPLLHIKYPHTLADAYPATLIVASRNDEVVDFANSLKYVALRRDTGNAFQTDKPVLFKLISSGGHHYESADKNEFFNTVLQKLQFLAQAMDLRLDKIYQ